MGTGTLTTAIDGTVIPADHHNELTSAIEGDFVPRNVSGVATTIAGEMGTSSLQWLRANIAAGYWDVGDIKSHHSYNGAAAVSQGWFPCDGTIINETNYNTVHGAGSWDTYISSSPLDGKYAPNFTGKYPVGAASTTQDGSIAITSVGNASHQVNLQHDHNMQHTHTMVHTHPITTGTANDDGGSPTIATAPANTGAASNSTTSTTSSPNTSTGLSTTENIQPESIETIYYVRII